MHMHIRPVNVADIDRCEHLDSSYTTEYVWRMSESVTENSMGVTFRRVRIPRPMEVAYPRGTEDLQEDLQRNECLLVAIDFGRTMGYLDVVVQRWRWQGWIEHLVVDRAYRRQGVATRLLEAGERWARGSELSAITVVIQSKNDPAIRLFSKRGYIFQGYIDHYFRNGDIGLVYSRAM